MLGSQVCTNHLVPEVGITLGSINYVSTLQYGKELAWALAVQENRLGQAHGEEAVSAWGIYQASQSIEGALSLTLNLLVCMKKDSPLEKYWLLYLQPVWTNQVDPGQFGYIKAQLQPNQLCTLHLPWQLWHAKRGSAFCIGCLVLYVLCFWFHLQLSFSPLDFHVFGHAD